MYRPQPRFGLYTILARTIQSVNVHIVINVMFSVLHIVFFIHNLNIFQLLKLSIDVFCTYTFYLKPTEARRHFAKT